MGVSICYDVHRCRLSGAEIWPDDDEERALCPITLELGRVKVSRAMEEYATSAIWAAEMRGAADRLLSYYNPRERAVLQGLLRRRHEQDRQRVGKMLDTRAGKQRRAGRHRVAAKATRKIGRGFHDYR